jgi:hypothetical protein
VSGPSVLSGAKKLDSAKGRELGGGWDRELRKRSPNG